MQIGARVLTFALLGAIGVGTPASAADPTLPVWAYPVNPPGLQPAPDDGTGTACTRQRRVIHVDADPQPVQGPRLAPGRASADARGGRRRKEAGRVRLRLLPSPNGLGRPENSSLAGLAPEYIVQQVADFKSGARRSSEPNSLPVNLMVAVAKAATDDDVKTAAAYFAALKRSPWIRVVESPTVPRTHVAGWMLVASEPIELEPIGQRIIEMPENLERTELRDAASGFIAYVPVGSVEKGRALATTGGAGKTIACAICHGPDLRGLGPVPGLAGRSPSYIVRQLYDMQHGVRKGLWTELMLPVVAQLSEADMVALAAYTASLAP